MSDQIPNKDFYKMLPGITHFPDIVAVENYSPLPDEWLVIATDIRGSTEAIAGGQYRAVNMAGACAIAVLLNDFPEVDIPFVFGGDGVTIAIPDVGANHVLGLLKYCKEAVNASFGLELAAGCRTMKELRKAGKEIRIGKFTLSEHVDQAIFWGDGVDYIEEIIKSKENTLFDVQVIQGDLSGLECRWNKIPSDKDEVLSIIIKSIIKDENERSKFYKDCFGVIEQIYGDASDYAPITEEKMSLTARPKLLGGEMLIRSYPARFFKRMLYILRLYYMQVAGWYLMRNGIETKNTRWGEYKSDFVKNADFRKFSDGLKLVVSGTVEQKRLLRSYLKKKHRENKLVFGTHSSPAAMTTCFVTDYQGKHVHFIDGTEGGYAMAAMELKQQMKTLKSMQSQLELKKHDAKIYS